MKTEKKPAWMMSESQYQAAAGVHQPWIAEISPVQYARMSKRQQRAYDEKRRKEWAASGACKRRWKEEVAAAYEAGEFTLTDPDLHPEALRAIFAYRWEQVRARAELLAAEYNRDREIQDVSLLKVGEVLLHAGALGRVRVVKVNRKSARVVPVEPPSWYRAKSSKVEGGWLARGPYKGPDEFMAEARAEVFGEDADET